MFFLLAVIIIIAVTVYFDIEITHFGIIVAAFMIPMGIVYAFNNTTMYTSHETYSGHITDKKQVKVSCSHSYDCYCITTTTGSPPNQTTSTVCQTCYDHSYDYDWMVYSTLGKFEIDRINRQGTKEPPRWTIVEVGEPAFQTFQYDNYIKGSDSIFKHEKEYEQYVNKFIDYPRPFDYYRMKHIFTTSEIKLQNIDKWNQYVSENQKIYGKKKEVNVIFIITKEEKTYSEALFNYWKGAEKNDVIVFIGYENNRIKWSNIKSWAKNDIFNVKLRDRITDMKYFSIENIINTTYDEINKSYIRRSMKEFEYLKDEIKPTFTIGEFMAYFIGFILSLFATLYVINANMIIKRFY